MSDMSSSFLVISLLPTHKYFLFFYILWLHLFISLIHCLDCLFKRLLSGPSALEEIQFLYSALMKHKLIWSLSGSSVLQRNLCVRSNWTSKSAADIHGLFIQFTIFPEITVFIIDHRNEKHMLHSWVQQQPSYLMVMKSVRLSQNSHAFWNSSATKCVH